MIIKNITYTMLAFLALAITGCETLPDPEVEQSSIYPLGGEWLSHVYNDNGTAIGATSSNPLGTLIAMRTYNTADNSTDQAWVRLGTTQAYALLGKVNCNRIEKTFSGTNITNSAKAGTTFTIQEAKVLIDGTNLRSGNAGDSIYVRYTTTVDNKVYVVKGHRRNGWAEDEY